MKFGNWQTMYEAIKAEGRHSIARYKNVDNFYAQAAHRCMQIKGKSPVDYNMLIAEREWYSNRRPYYKVWPSIIPALLKIKLDTDAGLIPDPPFRAMAIRFPDSNCLGLGAVFFFSCRESAEPNYVRTDKDRGLLICASRPGDSRLAFRQAGAIVLRAGEPVEAGIERYKEHNARHNDNESELFQFSSWLRCVLSVFLLAQDPSIIDPDVLADDRDRFDQSTDEAERRRFVDKAKRRGVVGWRIGEDYETIPHYRRPHFALRHTGKGRTVPRIVPIKGSVVHRKKLTEVPTGYLTEDGEEIE